MSGDDVVGTLLGSIFTRVPGLTSFRREPLVDQPGGVRVLSPRDILREGVIAPPDSADDRAIVPAEQPLLEVGDVVLCAVISVSGGSRVAPVTAADLPAVAGDRVLALRPQGPLTPTHLRWILAYLRSSELQLVASGFLKGALRVRWSELEQLKLPPLDEALAVAMDDLTVTRDRMSEWRDEATELLQSVLQTRNGVQARELLIASGQTLRLRAEAAARLDEFGYTVRTRFPYPIALRWRETEARMSAGQLREAYQAVLDTAEILLCYSALLVAAMARAEGIELSSVRAIQGKLAGGRGGPGFGEWVVVLEEIVSARKRKGLPAEHPLHEFGSLFADPKAAAVRKRVSDRRNDQAHQRRPDDVDLPDVLDDVFADLSLLLDRTRFLADLRLAHVTDVRWDTLQKRADVDFRSLMGDHPVVPTETMHHDGNDLETDSLYLIDREHRLHLLRPFLIGRPCPMCRSWSTFHVDKVSRDGAVLKSLEHGHALTDPTIVSSLSLVGLL
nr:restriction endonuclease [Streptomyces sp. SID13588]